MELQLKRVCISAWENRENADLEIQWPAGSKQTFEKLQANQLVVIREGSAAVERAPWPGR